jgi:signal transduction histidine kinase
LQNDLDKQIKNNAQAIARSLEFATEGLLEYGNTAILQRMVQNYATLPKIVEIDIVAPDGKSLVINKSNKSNNASTNNHKFSSISSELETAFTQASNSGLEIVIQTKIKNREVFVHILPFSSQLFEQSSQNFSRRGLAIVAIDLEQSRNEAWAIFITTTVTMFIGVLAILFLMLTLIHKYAVHPLKLMHIEIANSQTLDKIKLPNELPENEIGFLAATLVTAIAQLQAIERQKNAELNELNKELSKLSQFLETKVIERTAELTATNSELQKAKELAQESNKAKNLFLANMSHELRTPLNAILGFAQLIFEDEQVSGDIKEQIHIISQSGQNLLNMINGILLITKMESSTQKLNISRFYIKDLIKNVQEVVAFKTREKQLFFKIENQLNIHDSIEADELRLKQVLINILDNALKFTNNGGVTLRISSDATSPDHLQEYEHSSLYFEIEDTGIGISELDLDRIFEPLFQVNLGQHFYEGTGLGLPLSKQSIHLMGGDISVSSKPNQGSLLSFFFLFFFIFIDDMKFFY